MIYPAQRLAALAALGAPVALALGAARPGLWLLPLAWLAFLGALAGLDLLLAPGRRLVSAELNAPGFAYVGETIEAALAVGVRGQRPAQVEAALAVDERLTAAGRARVAMTGVAGRAAFPMTAARRGPAAIGPLDVRWRGPFGLMWRQRREGVDRIIRIAPDTRPVRDKAPRLLAADAQAGERLRPERGDAQEFDALGPWRPGEDKRRIDWKASARRTSLVARETRVERDNAICLAVDCGRLMTAPIAGVARLDRAISAALLLGYVALKSGDRVGLFGFDRSVRAQLPPISGPRAFAQLQAASGGLDYAEAETNFTLALSRLGQTLHRRTLILLFTDFTDPIGAELMLRAVAPLLKRHRLLCVVLADADLQAVVDERPAAIKDMARSVIAADLLRDRRIVFERLRRLGVEVVEAPWDRLGPAVVTRYLDLKRQGPL